MDLGLAGKTIFLSEGGTALGRAVADRLAAEGARLAYGLARPVAPGPGEAASPGTAIALPESGRAAAMSHLVAAAHAALGAPDALVAEMAHPLEGTLEEVSPARLTAYLDEALAGLWAFVRDGAARLGPEGKIVVLVSAAGKIPSRDHMAAAMAGAAQLAFVKTCSDHLGPRGITVNAVCVGDGPPAPGAGGAIGAEPFLGRGLGQQESGWGTAPPLGRWCAPAEVADAVAFLASARAGFITGANIDVDGGQQRMIF